MADKFNCGCGRDFWPRKSYAIVFIDPPFVHLFLYQRVEADVNVKREYEEKVIHVDINIPDVLKKKLEDDCFYINKRKKVRAADPGHTPLSKAYIQNINSSLVGFVLQIHHNLAWQLKDGWARLKDF